MDKQKDLKEENELNPEIMYSAAEDKFYKSEIEIFDRWQSFSAELLRLSLLGIAIFGFLYHKIFVDFDPAKYPNVTISTINWLSKASVLCFAFATVCALIYRYGSTEAMTHFLRGVKNFPARSQELRNRNWWLKRCLIFKILAAVSLGVGAGLSATAIFGLF